MHQGRVNLLAAGTQGKGPGYERWAKLHNIKQMAHTFLLLDEKGIRDMGMLCEKSEEASGQDSFDIPGYADDPCRTSEPG